MEESYDPQSVDMHTILRPWVYTCEAPYPVQIFDMKAHTTEGPDYP